MHDARPRRHHAVVLERLLRPSQKGITLAVALVFAGDVLLKGVSRAEEVDLNGVVDDEVGGHQGVDPGGVASHFPDAVTH